MCGLVAAIGDRAERLVQAGMARIGHRGVRSDFWTGRGACVGHWRLPIVGIGEENDQPVVRGDLVLAFVGEVLDFPRDQYECDVHFVVDRWLQHGQSSLLGRDGFWHVVAYDRADQSMYAVVDYLAQKPLYYREDLRAFASEPDALVAMGRTTLDEIYLSAVVKWGYCPETRRTPYREIRRMLPGETIVMDRFGVRERWVVDPLIPLQSSTHPRMLRIAIEGAIRRRVTSSDVPVAALVSGGLDSAITYTLAKRYGDVFPIHVSNGEWDEFCEVVGTDGFGIVDLDDVSLDKALGYMQEPLDLGSLVPQAALSDAVGRRSLNVCLTGDGADEMFGGYGRAQRYDSQWSDVYHELVGWHLPRLDRVMMRNRVEVRSPFLARSVAEMALGLRRDARTGKAILREAFQADLPRAVLDAPKRPLRTVEVEEDREGRSAALVQMFRKRHGETRG